MKRFFLLSLIAIFFFAGELLAKPGVILIHGYSNFTRNETIFSEAFSKVYWANWKRNAFSNVNVKHIPWDSGKRVAPQINHMAQRFQQYVNEGHCADGCVVFTHSTGGLVIDMLMSRALESEGTHNDFSSINYATTVVVPIASAGGGVNLAVYGVDIVMGACNIVVEKALSFLIPNIECGKAKSLGAGYDLQPNIARGENGSDKIRTPALMIAGYGNMAGNIIKPFLVGTSDGLVALHSACGGNKFESYDSCVSDMGPDGRIYETYNAPSLYKDHYPFIMTKEGHGSQLLPGLANTDLFSTKTEALISNHGFANIETQDDTSGALFWKKYYRNIENDERHLSTIIGDHFYF